MSDAYFGQQGQSDASSDFTLMQFLIRQALGLVNTGTVVKVVAVHGGGVGPAPTVDVQPLVNQIDSVGNPTPHGTVYGISVARNQGGLNAVINDPIVGDIGHMVSSSRDISSVKATAKQANPGSYRRHTMSDAVYHAAVINTGVPNQYVQFTTTGLKVVDKNGNIIEFKPDRIYVKPAPGQYVYLGGTGDDGSYGFVETDAGTSINVKAKVG